MERELYLSGIGGQGVQLASQVLARAALAEGRGIQLFGSYGGMMRGGNTETTLVVADGDVEAPPTVDRAWAVVLLHHDYSDPAHARRRAGGLLLVNSTVYEGHVDERGDHRLDVPATDLAVDVGNVMAASMVMAGALVAATGLVELDTLEGAVADSLPPYRQQHVALNVEAVRAGAAAVPARLVEAWPELEVAGG